MNRTWHIVRKDITRLRVPVALWLTFILVLSAWFRSMVPSAEVIGVRGEIEWTHSLGLWTAAITTLELLLGVVLVAALMLEDPIAGTTAFWLTRPIARARLLAAKLVSALLLLGLAPVIVMAVMWFLAGAPIERVAAGMWYVMRVRAAVFVVAVAIASLVRTPAQFLISELAVIFAWGFDAAFVSAHLPEAPSDGALCSMIGGTAAIVLIVRLLAQRRSWGWLALCAAYAASMIVQWRWPNAFAAPKPGRALAAATTPIWRIGPDGMGVVDISGQATRSDVRGFRVPFSIGFNPNGEQPIARLADRDIVSALAESPERETVEWHLRGRFDARTKTSGELTRIDVGVSVSGDMPLKTGEGWSRAGESIGIVALQDDQETGRSIVLQERGFARVEARDRNARCAVYVWVERTSHRAIVLPPTGTADVELDGQIMWVDRVVVPPKLLAQVDDLRDGALVRIRFAGPRGLAISNEEILR